MEWVRACTASEPLSELTLFGDWDSIASMIASLRIHLFDHGTIPVWNFQFCGGRPELAVPWSWAWTWPSLFAYALSPNYAILAVWAVLTIVGLASCAALLRRWTGSRLAGATGACVYAFSGYFAVTFVAGHVTFAFFHLVPLLMLLFERGLEARLAARAGRVDAALATLASCALWSGGLPHAIFHFLPAFGALVVVRVVVAARLRGARHALRAAALPVTAHALGVWLAAYKLWPVAAWQLLHPRSNVYPESRSALGVLGGLAGLVPDFAGEGVLGPRDPFVLGGGAYLGPVPWFVAALGLIRLVRRRPGGAAGGRPPDRVAGALAVAFVLLGFALALGNAHPSSPASWFRHFPLLSGIRGFVRFEILAVFGIAVLVAQAVAGSSRMRCVLALLAVAPLLAQAGFLAWRIPARPHAGIVSSYPGTPPSDLPEFVGVTQGLRMDRTALLEEGFWIANCYDNITLPMRRVEARRGARVPLSEPPPERIVALGRDRITLSFAPGTGGLIRLSLPGLEGFEYDAPVRAIREGRARFRVRDLTGERLTIRARYPGVREGAWASALGALALCFGVLVAARSAGRGPLPRPEGTSREAPRGAGRSDASPEVEGQGPPARA
jgi:hypothetical protein